MGKPIIINGEETEDRRQGERRKNSNGPKYIRMVILVIIAAIGWLFLINSRADIKIEKIEGDYTEIRMQLSQIQTDIQWIKEALKER